MNATYPDRLLQPGDLVGRFRAGTLLGAGGMGQVFLAEDERSGLDVALKILHPRWAGDDWLIELFHKEAELVRSLSHPNLVALLDVGHDPTLDLHFLVFEFIHGIPLDRLIEDGPLDPALATSIVQDIAMGLAAGHAAGVVHRDVKPANVMITPEDHIKLIDFGVADRTGAEVGQVEARREIAGPGTSGVCGTRVYSAPEQNQGRPATPAADVYSLGLVAYELFTGTRLLPDGALSEVLRIQARLQTLLEQSSTLHPAIPEPAARVIRRMLQLLPHDRYPSADEVVVDIESAAEEMGAVPEGALRLSKQTALADLADSLLLRAQGHLARGELEAAAAEFSRVLALRPPGRDTFVDRIRESVQLLFWKPGEIGYFPIRLLDMLEELGLKDLGFLVEHRLARNAAGSPRQVLARLEVYLSRWPGSAAFLRASRAAARGAEDPRELDFLERLGDALLADGEAAAAMRCFQEARKLRQERGMAEGELSEREQRVFARAGEGLAPAEDFHQTFRQVADMDHPADQAQAWKRFLATHRDYAPAVLEAAQCLERAGDRILAAKLCAQLGRRAFVAGALAEARRWFVASIRLDPERDDAILYLAEISGGVPPGESQRAQRVTLLRRHGLVNAALYHLEKNLTGGERDRELLHTMADVAEEWAEDPSPYILRRARLELDAGRDDPAHAALLEALERSQDAIATAQRILQTPGAVRALGPSLMGELRARVHATRQEEAFGAAEGPAPTDADPPDAAEERTGPGSEG